MKKIESLTKEQEAQLSVYRDKWIDIGLSTEPANRPKTEAAIRAMYRNAGLAEPEKIVWCGSPLSQGLTRAIIIDKKLRDSVRDSAGASVRASVRDSVGASVRASVWDSVGASVGASVRASVGYSVWASVGASVRDSVRDSVWDSVRASGYGQHDVSWLAFYEYFREVAGLTNETDKLTGLAEQAKNAGWYLAHQKICFVSERHSVLNRDDRGRLHSMTAPAVMYPDGWAIYAVHGVRVPSYIIETPSEITTAKIDVESNAEIRRVMIEIYGQDRYIIDSGAEEIHRDNLGALYKKELDGDEAIVMVKVTNSTPEPDGHFKDYFLRVPPDTTNASEAIAWTFGMKKVEYKPIIET